jgi:translation initiation factor 5A
MIEKRTGQVISVTRNMLQLMDLETYQTFETDMPTDEEFKGKFTSGMEVEYWNMLGKKKIVRVKG